MGGTRLSGTRLSGTHLRHAAALLFLTSCGSAPPTPVDTGFDPDLEARELSSTQLVEVCTSLRDGIAASLSPAEVEKLECLILAAGAFTLTECQSTLDACRALGGGGLGNPLATGLADCVEMDLVTAAADCTVTIKQLEECSAESIGRVRANIAGTSCTNVAGLNIDAPLQGPTCNAIESACPGLIN